MRALTAILLAALSLGAVACGGGDDDSEPRSFQDKAKRAQSPPPPAADTADATTGPASAQGEVPKPVKGGDGDDQRIKISSDDFPAGTWPLTIESGELRCEDTETTRTIIFSADGKDYPVNGVPEGGKIIGIEPIWKKKDDPNAPGTRMDITPLFKKGYELCG